MSRSGLYVQRAVIKALFMRELKTRFGKFRLGYLWIIAEPVAHLIIMLSIFGFIMHRTMPDISFPIFLINGIIPYLLFTNIIKKSTNSIEANKGLFSYKPVKPIDTVISRSLLESIIHIFVYIIISFCLILAGEVVDLKNLLLFSLSWVFLIITSIGVGLITMTLSQALPEIEKLIPMILRPFYFISCIMYPLHTIPKEYHKYILWNPLVHVTELNRSYMVSNYAVDEVSMSYLGFISLLIFFTGLAIYSLREEAMLTS